MYLDKALQYKYDFLDSFDASEEFNLREVKSFSGCEEPCIVAYYHGDVLFGVHKYFDGFLEESILTEYGKEIVIEYIAMNIKKEFDSVQTITLDEYNSDILEFNTKENNHV